MSKTFLNKEKFEVMKHVISMAISGMGLGSDIGKAETFRKILKEFERDRQINHKIIKVYEASVHSFLNTEIETITGYPEKDVYDLMYDLNSEQLVSKPKPLSVWDDIHKFIKDLYWKGKERKVFLAMFPKELATDVKEVSKIIPVALYHNFREPYKFDPVSIKLSTGETVVLPYRIDNDKEPPELLLKKLTERQKIILSCIYVMYHNGYVREKHLRNIITNKDYWVVPFVLKLLGDYVIEITKFIEATISTSDDTTPYKEFIRNNKRYWGYLKERNISYWSVYYRNKEYRKYTDCPTAKVAKILEK